MSNKILNLDLSKDPIMPAIVYGRVGDDRLQTVTVNLTRRDEVADLTGYDITFEGTTYNRQTKVFDSNNISSTPEGLKKGTFDYTFPNMAFAVAGKYEQAYFSIVKDGKRDSTAGFEIYVDGNADIDAPEAETIITEYNKLVAELNELQNQAIDEMNRNFTEAQGRISELEVQINDLRNKIDQALTDFENGNFWTKEESFNKEESSANVIYQLVGKEKVRMTFTADFSNKESGSDDKNPHWASAVYGLNELPSPSDFKTELVQLRYDSLKILDGQKTTVNTVAGTANQYPCLEHKWDIVEIIKRKLSEDFFVDRGAIDKASQATVAKKIIVSPLESSAWGFGTCPSGNSLKIANHINGVGWQTDQLPPNTTNLVKQITARNTATPSIDDEGFLRTIIYTEASSKTVQSQINVDYGNLVFSIEISMNEHIKSMMAAYHGENIATKEEALDGESNDKIMTPLRVKEVLNARENEIVTSNVFSAAFMRSGQISFMRRGPILIVNGTVTVKTAQAALTDLFVPDLGGKVPLNNAGNILAISDKAPYAKRFLISSNGGNFRTISALEADEYLAFSGSIMLAP